MVVGFFVVVIGLAVVVGLRVVLGLDTVVAGLTLVIGFRVVVFAACFMSNIISPLPWTWVVSWLQDTLAVRPWSCRKIRYAPF